MIGHELNWRNDMARIIDTEHKNMIGSNLKRIRQSRGMTQEALSTRLELEGVYVCRGSISRIEDYSRTVTDIELFAIAKILRISVDDLYEPLRE